MATEGLQIPCSPINDYSLLQKILPIGFRFMPTDQILIEHYLYNKIHGIPYSQAAVFDCDLYGLHEPWDIWNSFSGVDGQDLFFFTQLKRSTTKSGHISSHINRKIGSAGGTWSGENSATPILSSRYDDSIIAYCKRFRYENPNLLEHHGEWIMHEYSLHDSFVLPNCFDSNYVLCRLRKNERPKRKARLNNKCSSKVQSMRKKVMAPPMINDMPTGNNSNNIEEPKRKVHEECISKLQEKRQRVVTPTLITNKSINEHDPRMKNEEIELQELDMTACQGTTDVPCKPQRMNDEIEVQVPEYMTTNQSTDDMLWGPEMNQATSGCSFLPEMTDDEVRLLALDLITNQKTNDVFCTPELNQSTSIVPDIPELTTEEIELWMSDMTSTDVFYITETNKDTNDIVFCMPKMNSDKIEL